MHHSYYIGLELVPGKDKIDTTFPAVFDGLKLLHQLEEDAMQTGGEKALYVLLTKSKEAKITETLQMTQGVDSKLMELQFRYIFSNLDISSCKIDEYFHRNHP